MKILTFLLLAVALVSANPTAQNTSPESIPSPSSLSSVSPNPILVSDTYSMDATATSAIISSTRAPPISSTIPASTSSSAPSTVGPGTPTKAPPTTVSPSTTVAPSTTEASTTTTAPSTTSVPTTTNAPTTSTVAPQPASGKWSVTSNGVVCVLVQMAVRLNLTVVDNDKPSNKVIDVPANALASGICGPVEQNLTLTWPINNSSVKNVTLNDTLTLHFVQNATQKKYELHCVEVTVVDQESNKTKTTVFLHDADEFTIGLTNSYRCMRRQDLPLTIQGNNETVGYLSIEDLQFQAFRSDNGTTFGLTKDCAFDTPDVVPIAVGCALAALVVIVLVAYLVGRRRSQAHGYVSM